MKHIISPAVYLFVVAAIATSVLVVVYAITAEPIANQARAAQERTMSQVLPAADDFVEIEVELYGSMVAVYEGTSAGQRTGFVVSLAPMGFNGPIHMMVGISTADNRVSGMRVVRHTETPGLGDPIMREPFFSRFDDRPLNMLTVVRGGATGDEIDSLAAATITTDAVVNGFNDAVEWFRGGGF
jgi:electron transport complex protein RnfG